MTAPTRMSPEDSAFWKMESEVSRMHSVMLATFDGPAPGLDELQNLVARRVPLVPRFRQRVVEIPFDLGRPMWIDDQDFDLNNHVLAASVGADEPRLSHLVSEVVSKQLDRSRPLWQVTLVTGLADDRWAIVSKVHHSMIDGLFGTEPLTVLVDGAVRDDLSVSGSWAPAPPPGGSALAGRSLAELAINPVEQARFVRAQARRNRRLYSRMAGQRALTPTTDPTGLTGPVGAARTWRSLTVDMDAMRTARDRCETSIHELVLTLVTTGIRDLLQSRSESIASWPTVKAIVPIAVAGRGAEFHGGIEAEVVALPVEGPDLETRIAQVRAEKRQAPSNPVAIDAQIGLSGLAAPALASLGLREATRRGLSDHAAQTVIVNVPGPRHELSVLGRPMTAIRPAMPLPGGVRLSVGVLSYVEQMTFGITADSASMPDAQLVIDGIRRSLEELTNNTLETDNANS